MNSSSKVIQGNVYFVFFLKVYRSVLLVSKGSRKRRNSGSSETSKDDSGSNSPIPSENSKDDGNNDKDEKGNDYPSNLKFKGCS